MKREVIWRADKTILAPGGSLDPGSAPYPWQNSSSKQLHEVWNNAGAVDGEYAYCWPGNSPEQLAVGFERPPTLVRFTKLTITTGFDYSQGGPNNWWFPPNNDHGPGVALLFRKRDKATWTVGAGGASYQFIEADDNNVNVNTAPPYYKLKTLTWEMTAHPEGGPFTREDLVDGAIGVEFSFALGPNGKAYDNSQGSFFKIRVPYLSVVLEVEDLEGYVASERHAASVALRLMRRARSAISPETFVHHAAEDVGSRVYFSHPQGPAVSAGGWGARRLERRGGLVLQRTVFPERIVVKDEALDLRSFACLGWAAYRIDAPWSPELQGLALVEKGKGFTHTRAQDAWAPRPGDGALGRVLAGYPNLSFHGLAVCGGGDVSIALRNYDLSKSGWATVAASGGFAATADATMSLVDEAGYLSSCRLAYANGTGGRERSLGTLPRAAGDRLHVRVVVKNTSIANPSVECAEWYLTRSGGGLALPQFWDDAGRQWTTSATYNALPSADVYGEAVADAIPCDAPGASSDPTYAIAVGRFSSPLVAVTLHGAIVDVQHTDGTVAGARPPIVTLDATITRQADVHRLAHVWGRELWDHERGTAVAELRPFWRSVDLPADATKPLLHAQHEADTWDALQFVPKTGTDDLVRFERAIAGEGTYRLDCPVQGLDLTRGQVLRAWVRWLGADGWTEYAPFSVEVGYAVFLASTGALVSTGSVVGLLSSTTRVPYSRSYLGIGSDETRQADGYVRMWETRRNPLHGLEAVWKV